MTLDTDFKTTPVTAGGGRARGVDTRRMTLDAELKTIRALSRGGGTMQRETATVFFLCISVFVHVATHTHTHKRAY